MKKYSDLICQYLQEMGYTHCFFVAGGNIMHLIGSASEKFVMIPVVNEVAAGIAVEYFNASQNGKKAFAMVTAGPGLTNLVTAIAGAYFESRELLVIGGQVKVSDLSQNQVRQRGIQEIDGAELVKSICKLSIRIDIPLEKNTFIKYCKITSEPRMGPVFIEIPLDVQASVVDCKIFDKDCNNKFEHNFPPKIDEEKINQVSKYLKNSHRPIILLGGGLQRFGDSIELFNEKISKLNIPVMTTWNALDRIDSDNHFYFGRPDTWGQRYANVLIQQSDLLIAIGAKLGIQQTGFNWRSFIPNGKIIQIDCDENELNKGHPEVDLKMMYDANDFIEKILSIDYFAPNEWLSFCENVKNLLPLNDPSNITQDGYLSPYFFVEKLSKICKTNDVIVPCSSGGASTVMMQAFLQKRGQVVINNKALASMGYGLSGAIGASIANPQKRTILIEGDGGFSQNLQEIATAVANNLNLKIFIFENSGYASIRMTQKNYFGGKYVGCDTNTGLGFPNWFKLFDAYGVEAIEVNNENFIADKKFLDLFNNDKCVAFIVRIDPEQTYFPKISSRVREDGGMESNPLHLMTPDLEPELAKKVFKYIDYEKKS